MMQCMNPTHKLLLNSHDTSWQQTAKILLNANNGGNEHYSSKIAQETPPLKFKDESFGSIKCSKKSAEISPEMNRKMTGNDIFRPQIEFFGH